MTGHVLLTFNQGSSSIKLGVFEIVGRSAVAAGRGLVDLRHDPLVLRLTHGDHTSDISMKAVVTGDLREIIDELLALIAAHFRLRDLDVIGHRVVHGGDQFAGPVAISEATLEAIESLVPLAPLHQPQSVRLIGAIKHLRPDVLQTASFDTAFHRTQSDVVRRFGLPRKLFDEGIKHYGFHGLSFKYIAERLARLSPEHGKGRVVVAHLGSGASLCGLKAGVSLDTSMTFSTLDGLPMATRCGALDPGVLLYLVKERGCSIETIENLLYHQSGLLGVSGINADTRELYESPEPEAKEALTFFAFRVAREIAATTNTLGGLDSIVFTAGIGEHQPYVREAVCKQLSWLGVSIDPQTNAESAFRIDASDSKVAVFVIPTDEEQVIADEAAAIFREKQLGRS